MLPGKLWPSSPEQAVPRSLQPHSVHAGDIQPPREAASMLFLCRVALGSSSVGAANLRRPPDGFDSTTNGGGSGAGPARCPAPCCACPGQLLLHSQAGGTLVVWLGG